MALTQNERKLFDALGNPEYRNFALMQGTFRGKRSAFICAVTRTPAEEYILTPVVLLLRPIDLDECRDSDGRPLEKVA